MRGAALLLVLWLVALLTALVGTFALAARTEHLQGQVLSRGVVAQQAARAGIEYAITRIGSDDPRWRWLGDGREYHWNYAGAQVDIRIVDEQGKVDLNMADATLLASLLRTLGSDPQQAAQLAAAILDWRDPDSLTQPGGGAAAGANPPPRRADGAAHAPQESGAHSENGVGVKTAR
jgi:general secretion pathway protein K